VIDLAAIRSMQALLHRGYAADPSQSLAPLLRGIAHPAAGGWVASRRVLAERQMLGRDSELVMALLALEPGLRVGWLRIAAARCREAAQLADEAPLIDMVSQLGAAAAWVDAELKNASMASTETAAVERELLGVSAEQAAAIPMLMRVLGSCHRLQSGQGADLPRLDEVDPTGAQAQQNWCPGRLLALPGTSPATQFVLQGEGETMSDASPLVWTLANPWAFLLAAVAYAQDAWAAENRGGLLLELPAGQDAFAPAEIAVLVQGSDGTEVPCGTLGGLLLRSLSQLGVHCFPAEPTAAALDGRLTPLVGRLLQRQVWRFVEAASGSRGQYRIHPAFADDTYKIAGSKVFNRTGRQVWQSVRMQAEQLAGERRAARVTQGAN
jgi:hypothetical protein